LRNQGERGNANTGYNLEMLYLLSNFVGLFKWAHPICVWFAMIM